MKMRSALIVVLLVAVCGLSAFLVRRHAQWRSGFLLTTQQPYRFEPVPHVVAAQARRPVVTTTVTGGLYLLTAEEHDGHTALALRMSHDGGDSWMEPQWLSSPDMTVSTSAETAPQLAARTMYAYALWQEHSDRAGTQLRLARSSGMDERPPAVTNVTDKVQGDKSFSGFASLGLAPNGDVYAVWLDGRDNTSASTGTFNVYLARSTDKGLSFHKNVKVATVACPCCRPALAFGEHGEVYVAYRHVYDDNQRDIAVATSRDGGEHFEEPVRVATDRWKLLGCPESGPVMAVQHGRLLVAWFTAMGKSPGIRLAESKDGGRSFLPEQNVSGALMGANHPYLAATEDGTLALAFSARAPEQDGSWGRLMPYVVRISVEGRVSAPVRVPTQNGDTYPTVSLAEDGSAYVAWSAGEEDTRSAYLGRARVTAER